MKNIKILTVTSFLVLWLFSCDKEAQKSQQGGGLFKFKIYVSLPLQHGLNGSSVSFNNIIINTNTTIGLWWMGQSNNIQFADWTSEEISVVKEQNISVSLSLTNAYDNVCRSLKIEGIQNGKILKSMTYELGRSNSTPPITYCKDGSGININFVVE